MAVQVDRFPVEGRNGPPVHSVIFDEAGEGLCEGCGKQLTKLSAKLCRMCLREPAIEFAQRVRVLQAAGLTRKEIAAELGTPEGRVRRAIARANRLDLGLGTQRRPR